MLIMAPVASASAPALRCNGTRLLITEQREFGGAAPTAMPTDWEVAYTRCGAIERGDYYVDDTRAGLGMHVKYSQAHIQASVTGAERVLAAAAASASVPRPPRQWLGWLVHRYQSYLRGKRVLLLGSNSITVESLLLGAGVAHITVVDYNRLTYDDPRITTVTVAEARAAPAWLRQSFDVAFSLSSFDHDGLGRYGDPLCPDGDLLAMDEVRQVYLKQPTPNAPPSLFFLSVPVGPDVVVWNLHRRYGRVRLPLLLHPYRVMDVAKWEPERLDINITFTLPYEPVWVLTNHPAHGQPVDTYVPVPTWLAQETRLPHMPMEGAGGEAPSTDMASQSQAVPISQQHADGDDAAAVREVAAADAGRAGAGSHAHGTVVIDAAGEAIAEGGAHAPAVTVE